MSKFTKFDGYWFKSNGMVHLVWIGGTGVLKSILSSLILKVYHAFAFKPITIKFGEFTNFWMLFQMTAPFLIQSILNIRTEKKYVRTQSPARLEHGQLETCIPDQGSGATLGVLEYPYLTSVLQKNKLTAFCSNIIITAELNKCTTVDYN